MKPASLFCLIPVAILASTHLTAQPDIRIKAGGVYSSWRGDGLMILQRFDDLTGSDLFSQQGLASWYAGVSATWPLGDHLSIEPGLQYSRTGASLGGDLALKVLELAGAGLEVRAVSQRVEMPLLLKAELVEGLHLVAGPQLNYAFDSQLRLQGSILGIRLLNRQLDIGNLVEPVSVAALGGLQYQFANGVQIQGMYEYGLSRIARNNAANIYQNSIRVGLGIPVGRKG